MNLNIFAVSLIVLHGFSDVTAKVKYKHRANRTLNSLPGHTKVTDGLVFPYVVAILKKFSYLCAGALLDDKWVLTAADSFYALRESSRVIRVRLGSINYKKGGSLLPVKTIEIHPHFDDSRPVYDVALIRLAYNVRLTAKLYPIRMQTKLKEVIATHVIVSGWSPFMHVKKINKQAPISTDLIKQQRILSISHLHPWSAAECKEELNSLEINDTEAILCLELDSKSDSCWRDTGAPVVLNGVLWGIVSSWHQDDCYLEPGATFVNLVAAKKISSWIYLTTYSGNKTEYLKTRASTDEDYSYDV
ncbi:hypothetical protein evm_008406 [Chilo suppressalis]|nr:hypothetical protein evm_008406 [Chilo suppressalis]